MLAFAPLLELDEEVVSSACAGKATPLPPRPPWPPPPPADAGGLLEAPEFIRLRFDGDCEEDGGSIGERREKSKEREERKKEASGKKRHRPRGG